MPPKIVHFALRGSLERDEIIIQSRSPSQSRRHGLYKLSPGPGPRVPDSGHPAQDLGDYGPGPGSKIQKSDLPVNRQVDKWASPGLGNRLGASGLKTDLMNICAAALVSHEKACRKVEVPPNCPHW